MKDTSKEIIGMIVGLFIVIIVTSGITYWFGGMVDRDCLREYVEDFCELKGFEVNGHNTYSFTCKESLDLRESRYGKLHQFYFLDEEIEDCRVKDKYTFKKFLVNEQEETHGS